MKTFFTIIALLVSVLATAQYRTETALVEQLKSGQISIEAYSDMALDLIHNRKDSVRTEFIKPHYNASLDIAVIAGGVLYQKFGNNVRYDYILHGWGGYFGSKAIAYGLDRMGCSKTFCALGSFLSVSLACVAKEFVDSEFNNDDLIAGMGGAALASLSYTIDIERIFKKERR